MKDQQEGKVLNNEVALYVGEALGKYGFPNGHPFGPDRQDAFWKEALKQGLDKQARICDPRLALREEIERFHTGGRIMGFGGGGYNRDNLAQAWCAVLNEFIRGSER